MNHRQEIKTRHFMQFLGWLQKFDPDMHALVIERIGEAPPANDLERMANGLNGLGQFDLTSIFPGEDAAATQGQPSTTNGNSWDWVDRGLETVGKVAQGALQYKAQQDLIKLQMARIEQGKPPIDTALISPTVRVQADLPPAIQKDITDMKRVGVFAVGGVALAIMAFLLLRRR